MVGIGTRLGLSKVAGGVREKILETELANLITYWPQGEIPASQEYLTFNGLSTNVDMGSDASLDDIPSAEFTVDFWVYIDDLDATYTVIGKTDGSTLGWRVVPLSNGNIRFYVYYDTANAVCQTGIGQYTVGEWIHICAWFDPVTGGQDLAINGEWKTSNVSTRNGSYQSDAAKNLYVGSYDATGQWLDGNIGWVRISDNDRYDGATPTNFTPPARTTIPTVDANTVGLWPFNEGYGTAAGDLSANDNDGTITDGDWGAYPAADNAEGTAARDGAYTGVTLGQLETPLTAPLFDGVNDFNNIYSASFDSAFSGAEGTLIIFVKVSGVGVWSDGIGRNMVSLFVNSSNYIYLIEAGNGSMSFQYRAGGVFEQIAKSGMSETGWFFLGMTWDKAGSGYMTAYYNGAQEGTPQAIGGIWAGSFNAARTVIGAAVTSPGSPWDGYLAHCAVWTKALTAAQILAIYQASGI